MTQQCAESLTREVFGNAAGDTMAYVRSIPDFRDWANGGGDGRAQGPHTRGDQAALMAHAGFSAVSIAILRTAGVFLASSDANTEALVYSTATPFTPAGKTTLRKALPKGKKS